MPERRLTRRMRDRVIAGVCGGLADYFEIDATIVRVAFVIAFFAGVTASFWVYLILWLIMPRR